jgi:hypothetical protein
MPKITQRDIVDSVVGLRAIAFDLRQVTQKATPESDTTMIRVAPLVRYIAYLDQVADELKSLIPDDVVVVPKDD